MNSSALDAFGRALSNPAGADLRQLQEAAGVELVRAAGAQRAAITARLAALLRPYCAGEAQAEQVARLAFSSTSTGKLVIEAEAAGAQLALHPPHVNLFRFSRAHEALALTNPHTPSLS